MDFYEIPAEATKYTYFRRGMARTFTHFHSAVELLIVERGEICVTIDDETRTLRRGDVCFTGSFSLHAYETDDSNASVYVLVGNKTIFDRIFSTLGGVPPKFFRFEDIALIETLFTLYTQNSKNDGSRYASFEATVNLILARVALSYPFTQRPENKQVSFVCDVLRYAQEHYKDNLSLATLSRVFGYSREYLSRLLSKYLHENWNCYLARIRVQKAREVLETELDKTVLEIALEHGFESANTFYRAYKREFGVPPRQK